MEKRRPHSDAKTRGIARRQPERERILAALHGICLKIEEMQQSEEGRLACREVADWLNRARLREGGKSA